MKKFAVWCVVLSALAMSGAAALLLAQQEPKGPPQFTTIPIHARFRATTLENGHIIFVPPIARHNINGAGDAEPGAAARPGNGGGGGGGGGKPGGGGGKSDFGQTAGVLTARACFANSTNNVDVTCASDSYQGEPAAVTNPSSTKAVGGHNDIYPGNCSSSAAPGAFGDCGISVAVSSDGVSWDRYKLTRNWGGIDFLIGFDPSVAMDSQGRYFAAYGVSDGSSSGKNAVVVASSSNGGATWTKANPVVLNKKGGKFEDKYWIAADANAGSPFRDRLYVAWDRNQGNNQILLVSTSSDQGKTWSSPVKINDGTSSFERVIYAFPAVAPDGTVYVLWHDYAFRRIYIDKSTDGGATWGTDVAVASTNIGFGTDIGCNGGRSMTPAPQMAIAANGDIYIVFARSTGGAGATLDVFLTKSTNGGATWSAPARVSSTSAGHQYNPAIAIDSAGAINVSYLDRRDDPANCRTHTYLSRSTNGGGSFAESRITDFSSNFNGNPNGPGDYQGIACRAGSASSYFSDHRDANATNDGAAGSIDGGFEIYAKKP